MQVTKLNANNLPKYIDRGGKGGIDLIEIDGDSSSLTLKIQQLQHDED